MPTKAVIDYYRKQGVAPRVADAIVASAAQRAAARAEAIAAYGRAAELAVRMGYPERVSAHLSRFSRTEIEHMTAALYQGLDVAAAQQLAQRA